MPAYPYTCPSCDLYHEVNQSIHEDLKVPSCPSCSNLMERVWEPAAVSFKGGGFYSTDYRR